MFSQWLLSVLILVPAFSMSVASAQDNLNIDEVSLSDLMDIKIESASKQVEPLSEAPVPTTVITKEMIQNSGARTIHEALILFVPGYTDAEDRNELNFAPRGIYATSQQKVLIMINGHRINSRSYLTAGPGYGIAIHNVERIEVLRGPGSSLYGNVALGGVINLITKKGKDVNGGSVDISGGDHGQRRLRFVTGSGTDDTDVLAWGQFYKATGEIHELDGNEKFNTGKTGTILIDGADDRATHDFGVQYKRKNWTLLGASRQDMWIEPYGSSGNTYSHDDYRTFMETGPGLGLNHKHFGAKYDGGSDESWSWSINPYYDRTEIIGELATNSSGGGVMISWVDEDFGFIAQGSKNYSSSFGDGNLIVGTQVDTFKVTDSLWMSITGYELGAPADTKVNPLLALGGEEIYSGFVQNKHRFSDKWILNAGFRYDYKNRRTGKEFQRVSPRVALINLPNDTWEYKLSYSESFVDAPYWYRYTTFPTFAGSEFLNPEVLRALQFQTVWKSSDKNLRNSSTVYYQNGTDLIVNTPAAAQKYVNSGSIESFGLENEVAWYVGKYQVNWNFQYAQALSSNQYSRFGGKFAHVPNWTSNLVLNYLFNKNGSANVTVQYIGDQVYNIGTAEAQIEEQVPSAILVNVGGRYNNIFHSDMYIDARVYNALDAERFQGGQSGTQFPFRQAGRWMMATLGFNF